MRYQLTAVRIAYLLVQDHAAAEDIVQDSFLLAYRGCRQFREGSLFAPWFYRIVLNEARQHLRTAKRHRESSLDTLQLTEESSPSVLVESDPSVGVERTEERAAILDVLRRLTPKQREVLVLRYYGGYTDQEIARILSVPGGTVRWRLHTALRAFERAIRRVHPWLIEPESGHTLILAQDEGGTHP
jgi:RNA polymerase sigma-70 factor (ECF subfamily)